MTRWCAGFLYQPGDYAQAIHHVRSLVDDAALRTQMGREARLEVRPLPSARLEGLAVAYCSPCNADGQFLEELQVESGPFPPACLPACTQLTSPGHMANSASHTVMQRCTASKVPPSTCGASIWTAVCHMVMIDIWQHHEVAINCSNNFMNVLLLCFT